MYFYPHIDPERLPNRYLECICSKAEHNWAKYFQIVFSGISRCCFLKYLIILPKSPASASSRTIFNSLFSMNEDRYWITFAWHSCLSKSISRIQSVLDLASIIWNSWTFFKATVRPSHSEVALKTSENCPFPKNLFSFKKRSMLSAHLSFSQL